jgi:Beta protein
MTRGKNMLSNLIYVPLLKGKQGEFRALLNLGQQRNSVVPLLEHEPVAIADPNELKKILETKYIQRFLKSNWIGPAFVDLYQIRKESLAGTMHPLELVLEKLSVGSINPIPVVGPNYPDHFKQAAKKFAPKYGVCIRLRVGLVDPFDLVDSLNILIKDLKVSADQVDLILDFGPISESQKNSTAFTAVSLIQQLKSEIWKTFTLASGAFPVNLEQVKGGTHGYLERTDWEVWKMVFNRLQMNSENESPIFFGDYGINHPDFPSANGFMTIVPSLRYTLITEPKWLALKEAKSDQGNKAFFDLCRRLVRMPEYAGRHHCWADDEIYERAQGRGGPGNATTWRELGSVHHITTVVEQLASHHGF